MDNCLTDMPCTDHDDHWGRKDGFHKDLHSSATHTWVAALRVGHRICQQTRLAVAHGDPGFIEHTMFQIAASNRAYEFSIGVDEHFAAHKPRRGSNTFHHRT